MPAAMKAYDFIGADPGPMTGPLIHQPARDIEGSPRIVFLENPGAGGGGAFGDIVERETDHRGAGQLKRRSEEMPGQPVADARL
jgi:hypothetical protein